MEKISLVLFMLLLTASLAYAGWVGGYTRSDGTYVQGRYCSDTDESSDNQKLDMWNNVGEKHNLDPFVESCKVAQEQKQSTEETQRQKQNTEEDYISLAEKGIVKADPNDTDTFAISGLPGRFKRIK